MHGTEFFLYNVENYLLCGDMGLDRTVNKPETDYLLEKDQEVKINGEIINCDMIGHIPTINSVPNVQVVMRLHFLVHSWINMYIVKEG